MTIHKKPDPISAIKKAVACRKARPSPKSWMRLTLASLCVALPLAAHAQFNAAEVLPPVKTTYVRLSGHANALLLEPTKPNAKTRILAINTHSENYNNFENFAGRLLVERGYRVLEVNYYGPERTFEEFLSPLAAAVRYARTVPGVKTVVLAGHSGGGPELSYYEEIAEKGPSACQEPGRLYPCDGKDLAGLPKADALMLLEANAGAAHWTIALDPAVSSSSPKARNPALDMYAPQNGFDPKTNVASYGPEFIKRYSTALHERSEGLIAVAQAKLKGIEAHTEPFNDDEPFVVVGMAEHATGSRLNLADPKILSQTHAPHMELKADGTSPVQIVHSTSLTQATPVRQRDTLAMTVQDVTVRHFLSFIAIRTTSDFELTVDDIKGVDWRSSAASMAGNVENVSVPTLVMAGSCFLHMIPLEIAFDHSAAKDKEFVAVEGADHLFRACRPEFGNTQKRAFDYVDAWLTKRF